MRRVLFFRPTLGDGGADRVTLTVLQHLDRARFAPSLALVRRTGVLADEVANDVPVIDLEASRLALSLVPLTRAIRASKPDIVVCTAGGANAVCVAAHALARSDARLVLSERSAARRERSRARLAIELPLKRALYRHADVVAAVSEGVARDLVDLIGVPPDRVRVVYNPIIADDTAALAAEPVDHPWFHEQRPIVLAVGRLVPVKDLPTTLAAFARIRQAIGARLVVLGEGPLKNSLISLASTLGVADDVAFLGYHKNPYRFMRRAHVLLQSSLAEGLPGVLIQSLACGTPVVATDCEHGPREVVRDGVDGFLVSVGDAAALAERAVRLLSDDPLRSRLRQAGIERAARFTVSAAMERYHAAIGGGT